MLSGNELSVTIIGVYCAGIIATMMMFIGYWYNRTGTTHIALLCWAGFAFALLWPLYLFPCFAVCVYFSTPFFLELFHHFDGRLSEAGSQLPPGPKPLPKVVRSVDPTQAAAIDTHTTCPICQEELKLKKTFIRSRPGLPEVVLTLPETELNKSDFCITLCDHGFHYECLDNWVHKRRTCPSCRKEQTMADCLVVHRSGKYMKVGAESVCSEGRASAGGEDNSVDGEDEDRKEEDADAKDVVIDVKNLQGYDEHIAASTAPHASGVADQKHQQRRPKQQQVQDIELQEIRIHKSSSPANVTEEQHREQHRLQRIHSEPAVQDAAGGVHGERDSRSDQRQDVLPSETETRAGLHQKEAPKRHIKRSISDYSLRKSEEEVMSRISKQREHPQQSSKNLARCTSLVLDDGRGEQPAPVHRTNSYQPVRKVQGSNSKRSLDRSST